MPAPLLHLAPSRAASPTHSKEQEMAALAPRPAQDTLRPLIDLDDFRSGQPASSVLIANAASPHLASGPAPKVASL